MGKYDLPATIDYVIKNTGQKKITYLAHSMGNSAMYYGLATNEKYFKDKVNLFVQLNPVIELKNTKSPFLLMVVKDQEKNFKTFLDEGLHEFYGKGWDEDIGPRVKSIFKQLKFVRKQMIPNKDYDDPIAGKVLENHFPHGTSLKTITHLG